MGLKRLVRRTAVLGEIAVGLELHACLGLLWGLNSTSLGVGGRTFQDLELPGSSDRAARLGLWRQKKAHADACK